MSIARREAKCSSDCLRCAGQKRPPVQRATASPSSFFTVEPHTGHFDGSLKGSRRGPFEATRATSGMTSPARRTTTVSPAQMSLRRTSSSLCSVAFTMVVPPTKIGSSRATGVIAPVRPTWKSIATSLVVASSAGNLCAIAQRGARETKPSACWSAKRLTLYTTPSMS